MKTIAVVTATIGRESLKATTKSVAEQTFPSQHYVFFHGYESWGSVKGLTDPTPNRCIFLPHNNGANGYGCSPVYAAAPFIVREDYILYLDDDNLFELTHVESLMQHVTKHNLKWAYSLRKVIDHEGKLVCEDDCESLGVQPNATGHYLVDQNCFIIERELARKIATSWYNPICSDRFVFQELMNHRPFGTTGLSTVRYRLSKDGSNGMPAAAFLNNNLVMKQRHGDNFPWRIEAVFS